MALPTLEAKVWGAPRARCSPGFQLSLMDGEMQNWWTHSTLAIHNNTYNCITIVSWIYSISPVCWYMLKFPNQGCCGVNKTQSISGQNPVSGCAEFAAACSVAQALFREGNERHERQETQPLSSWGFGPDFSGPASWNWLVSRRFAWFLDRSCSSPLCPVGMFFADFLHSRAQYPSPFKGRLAGYGALHKACRAFGLRAEKSVSGFPLRKQLCISCGVVIAWGLGGVVLCCHVWLWGFGLVAAPRVVNELCCGNRGFHTLCGPG